MHKIVKNVALAVDRRTSREVSLEDSLSGGVDDTPTEATPITPRATGWNELTQDKIEERDAAVAAEMLREAGAE